MPHTKTLRLAAALVGAGLTAGSLQAAPVNQVAYATLTGTALIDFEDLAQVGAPGLNFDGIFESGGADFAERFVGQTLSFNGNHDVLSGAPNSPLALQVGAAGQNLNVFSQPGNVLTGLGPLGFPNFDAIGEGAFSVLFDFDQSEFGFQLVGGNAGTATVDFYRRDGSLVESIILASLNNDFYGFSREGGVADIAGVSVYNIDAAGVGFDNLKHTKQGVVGPAVPEAGSALALLSLGFLSLLGIRRRS